MVRRGIAAIALSAALLAGCGRSGAPAEGGNAATAAPVRKPKPLSQVDPQAYHDDPSTAMREVPAALRPDIQRLIACRVTKGRADGAPVAIDATLIRGLTARLVAGASVDDACRA